MFSLFQKIHGSVVAEVDITLKILVTSDNTFCGVDIGVTLLALENT